MAIFNDTTGVDASKADVITAHEHVPKEHGREVQ